jgi:hypothetical protein
MRDRWLPVGVLSAVLFAVGVVARLVARFAFGGDEERQGWVTFGMLVVTGLILAAVAFVWGRRYPTVRWTPDLAVVILVAMALTVLVGPFISGSNPFANGPGHFFAQIWWYGGFTIGGSLIGYLLSVALGLDYRSQSLKRFAETVGSKPSRVARR